MALKFPFFHAIIVTQLSLSPTTPHDPVSQHILVLLPKKIPRSLPRDSLHKAVLAQRGLQPDELASTCFCESPSGDVVTWAMLNITREIFTLQTQVRKALQLMLKDKPKNLAIVVLGEPD